VKKADRVRLLMPKGKSTDVVEVKVVAGDQEGTLRAFQPKERPWPQEWVDAFVGEFAEMIVGMS
jgi:hypothetical protein